MRYIIDSNIFIQSKNFEYKFQYCQIFWDLLESLAKKNIIYSINAVKREISAKQDELNIWVENKLLPNCKNFFENEFDSIQIYSKVINWVNSQNYTNDAKKDFSNGIKADAFIIAHAIYSQSIIVTGEVLKNNTFIKRVPIPNVANNFGIKCITLFDLLQNFTGHNFSLK